MAEMKAAEATEWGEDQGPRDKAKGRFCITTVKSHPKLTSGAGDRDTCVASEIGALPLSIHSGRASAEYKYAWSQAGRKLQSQAPTGEWYSIPPPAGASSPSPAATF